MEWKILPRKSPDLKEQLLINRGLKSTKEKNQFLNPKISDFDSDLKIPGIEKAKKRILKAIKNNELIIVYGDYDVDGICGAAVLYLGLTSLGAKVLPYIPHREKEGYGLGRLGLQTAFDQGAKLVISVDCGIVNFQEAKIVQELGLELIITDHHQKDGKGVPNAFAIVHSTKMCGAAVAWCLIRNLVKKEIADDLLDLVAIATVADMMPMLGINRALVRVGLEYLNKTNRVGLLSLFDEAGIKKGTVTAYEIGHLIAPRLNAMGRLEHAIDSLRLICTKDPMKARRLTQLITDTNSRRVELTRSAMEEAQIKIAKEIKNVYVLSSSNWSPGIIGLVAGRICEITKKPTIAISIGETHSKGSARSVNGINIIEVIRQCSDILVAVGGHPGAAGFTIPTLKIAEFQKRMEEIIEKDDLMPENQLLDIEAEIPVKELNMKLVKSIEELEPFGIGNPKPILATLNMKLSDLRTVGGGLPAGRQGKHLKGKVDNIEFIGFGMGNMINNLSSGQFVNLAYNLEIDKFNGSEKLQLKIKDLHPI